MKPVRLFAVVFALIFLGLHLPYLPASLEDLDSINFGLAVERFDVAQRRPHPPGYPIFIVAAKAMHALIRSEATALGAISLLGGTLGAFALVTLFARIDREPGGDRDGGRGLQGGTDIWLAGRLARAELATLLTATAPLFWVTAVRPLSDMAGLSAAVGVQALTLSASGIGALATASFLAAVAAGIRSQVFWLTVPLLMLTLARRPSGERRRAATITALAYVAGGLVWGVPLVWSTGGPVAYVQTVLAQSADDLSGVRMLWTVPTARELIAALQSAFVAPWALWSVAVVVLVFAAIGAALAIRYARQTLLTLAFAFVPYLVFDLLFQETVTTRYALPLVVPVGYLAARGASAFGRRAALAVVLAVSMFDAHIGGTSLAVYAGRPAPAFRMLGDMVAATTASPHRPVLGMDRREELDLRRPIQWIGGLPGLEQRLASPPQREWLELVSYWNRGGRAPVWFVADPKRTDIDLVAHAAPADYSWSLPYPALIGGIRPNDMRWYRIDQPDWYVGEGWALTPEAAGVSHAGGRGPSVAPIEGWVSRRVLGGVLAIGGRNLSREGHIAHVTAAFGGAGASTLADFVAPPGPFLHIVPVPRIDPPGDYVGLTVRSSRESEVAIEQFDASQDRVIFGFGAGWQEPEYDPETGLRWRWLSEQGELRFVHRGPGGVVLHVEGESPRRYFARPSRLVARMEDRLLLDEPLSSDFSLDIAIPPDLAAEPPAGHPNAAAALGTPAGHPTSSTSVGPHPSAGGAALGTPAGAEGGPPVDLRGRVIILETDQVFVPAEGIRRIPDQRHLGLRIFKCVVRTIPSQVPSPAQAFAPGRAGNCPRDCRSDAPTDSPGKGSRSAGR